jgi:hypothetical protein
MGAVSLQRIGKLSTAVTSLVSLSAAASVLSIWASGAAQSDARDLLDGEISNQQFVERTAPYLLMTTVQGVITLAAAVLTMILMFRIAKNHRTLHRGGTWGPGWAIGGWLLPPLLFVIPFLMLRELWKASDPESPIGADWRSNRVSPLVPIWFVLYSLIPIVLLVLQSSSGFSLGASERDLAQQIIDDRAITFVDAAVAVAGAAVFVLLVRGLTARHQRLTGELTMTS